MLWRRLKLDWRYAFGELTIVVVGVLIALAVDQWNAGRGDLAREHEYVASLRLDLGADTSELSRALGLAQLHASSARRVLHVLETELMDGSPEELIRAVEFAGLLYFPAYSRYTFDDLMSTGNLRLIRDTSLKRELAAYYATIDRAEQWMDNWRAIQRRYQQWVSGVLSLSHREAITAEPSPGTAWLTVAVDSDSLDATVDDAWDAVERMNRIPGIDAALKDMIWVQGRHSLFMQDIQARAAGLLNLLQDRSGPAAGVSNG